MDALRALDAEVHLWCADPAELDAEGPAAAARALLTTDEIERLERFLFPRDRALFLAAHALVRTTLSRYCDVAPRDWRFATGPHGRPEIAGERPPLRFNLSHTQGLAVCAVTRDLDVGVDVEDITRRAPLEVARRYFAAAEVAALEALPVEDRPLRFFEYWTLKESYIKARGLGLALPLARFAFTLGEGAPRLDVDPALGDHGDRWQLAQLRPTQRHLVALCVARRPTGESEVVLRPGSPAALR